MLSILPELWCSLASSHADSDFMTREWNKDRRTTNDSERAALITIGAQGGECQAVKGSCLG